MDVIIVGAGLAGLVAATTLARAGRTVTVFERSGAPGGRAVTTRVEGAGGANGVGGPAGDYRLNLGPHALYTGGATARTLAGLGVT